MESIRYGFLNFGGLQDDAENSLNLPKNLQSKESDKKKAFAFVSETNEIPALARDLQLRWLDRVPDIMISFVSGYEHFHTWKRDDFRSALQAGILKLFSVLDILVIDDGLNYGLTRLVGTAVKVEENFRTYSAVALQSGPRKPILHYIGVVPLASLASKQLFYNLEKVDNEIDVSSQVHPSADSTEFELNRNHSNYLIVDQSYADTGFLRIDFEKQLQNELAMRGAMGKDITDSAERSVRGAYIPHIVFFFQGEIEELDRILAYVRLRTPVIIMNGCGGMADVVAFAIKNRAEPDEVHLRKIIGGNFARTFMKTDEEITLCVDKIIEIVLAGAGPEGNLCFVIDCTRLDSFGNLDATLLQAIITNSAEQNATQEQMVRNMRLCILCNKPEIAHIDLITKPPWSFLQPEYPSLGLITALIFPGREAFVDLFLKQKFPLHRFVSHLELLALFRKAIGRELFISLVWDDILGHNQSDAIREEFILTELNPLIYQLTNVKDFINFYELSRVAFTKDETIADIALADEKALNALVIFGILFNRAKLVKVLLKYAIDPVPLTVFVETMYRGLYRRTNNLELKMGLKRQADEFGDMATSILDMGIRESPERAKSFFSRQLPDYNNKTILEMAYDARNKKFIAHPLVQNWLDGFSLNFIRVRGGWHDLKMLLSAWLIFPIYIWLAFPRHTPNMVPAKEAAFVYDPKTEDEADDILRGLSSKGHTNAPEVEYKEIRPSIKIMISALWTSPVVKFWSWFTIYSLFLIILGVDMMIPACRYIGVDIAVFVCTALMWLELNLRTVYDFLWKRRVDPYSRALDIIYQTVWNIIFFLYRIAPYRYDHPFAGRVILAFGVMYYFYAVWQLFYSYDRQLGPLVRIVNIMFKQDMPKWIIMMLPFFVSSAVVWQAVITPDYPFTGDDWRRAFYRATFTIFGAFYNELEYNDKCEKQNLINWNNFTQPASADPFDRCWLGDYNDYTCNTVSFWAYVFVINYYFFLKLGMIIILVVFYIFRQSVEMPKADLVWRYTRFNTMMDYYYRSPFPFPLNIFGNIYLICMFFIQKGKTETTVDSEMADTKLDTFAFWKTKAAEFFQKKDQEDSARGLPMKQSQLLGSVKGEIQSILHRFGNLDNKLMDVDEKAKGTKQRLKKTTNDFLRQNTTTASTNISLAANPHPHIHSRESPYFGTDIKRVIIPENKIEWIVPFQSYEPVAYSRSIGDFSPEEQDFVDPERDDRELSNMKSSASTKSSEWNSVEIREEDAVYRKTWIVDVSNAPVQYQLDRFGLPVNPIGRTGLRGRGGLCRYGPNHRIILLITSASQQKVRYLAQVVGSSIALPSVPLCHYDSEYSVAAAFFDSIFGEEDSELDPSVCQSLDDLKTVVDSVVRMLLGKNVLNRDKTFPAIRVSQKYRGYFDSPMNTDNAWCEVLILHVEIPLLEPNIDSVYRWRMASNSEAGMPDLDATVLRNLTA